MPECDDCRLTREKANQLEKSINSLGEKLEETKSLLEEIPPDETSSAMNEFYRRLIPALLRLREVQNEFRKE